MAAALYVRALALKKTKLGETDLIVTFLVQDGSQMRAVAKGARKPGSRLSGRVELFSVVDLLVHPGRTLFTISEAELVSAHAPLREDYDRFMAASVVADFLDKTSVEEQAEERLFGLAVATLDAMEAASADALFALVVAFLLKGVAMHGYRPQFLACAVCGRTTPLGKWFSLSAGGPLCPDCEGEYAVSGRAPLSPAARAALVALMGARMAEVGSLGILHPVLAEAFAFVRAYTTHHVPARLKALGLYAAQIEGIGGERYS